MLCGFAPPYVLHIVYHMFLGVCNNEDGVVAQAVFAGAIRSACISSSSSSQVGVVYLLWLPLRLSFLLFLYGDSPNIFNQVLHGCLFLQGEMVATDFFTANP